VLTYSLQLAWRRTIEHFISAIAVLAASSTLALAGGPVTTVAEPEPVAAAPVAVHDWSGAYVGLGYGKTSGDVAYTPGGTFDLNSGSAASIFAGYLWQRGSLVYGGELAYSRGNDTYALGFPTENVERMVDLKARVGYAANKALFYGVVGYSILKYDIPVLTNSFTTSGVNYGLGMDFAVTKRVTMGIEYLVRNTDGATFNAGQTADLDVNTITLRFGYSF